MKVCFIYAEKIDGDKGREFILADNFLAGVSRAGDSTSKIRKGDVKRAASVDADAVCMVGVKSLKLFRQMRDAGKHVIYFDKGYFRHRGPGRTWEYWRIAVNDHHPTDYITNVVHSSKRWDILAKRRAVEVRPWRDMQTAGPGHVVYAGSSDKYHAFAGLPDPTSYAERIIGQIKKITDRPIVYRPKPTWYEATAVDKATFSPRTQSIHDALHGAWCLVTNGSNSSYDAMLAGIPSVVIGKAIARPISSTDLADIEKPRLATKDERHQWLSNLAWCMFTEAEMAEGLAWQAIRPQLTGESFDETTVKSVASVGIRPSKAILKKTGQWAKDGRTKRTKEEQRLQGIYGSAKPFTKVRVKERYEDDG
jgi:hypothetical protein